MKRALTRHEVTRANHAVVIFHSVWVVALCVTATARAATPVRPATAKSPAAKVTTASTPSPSPTVSADDAALLDRVSNAMIRVARAARPSVVCIQTSSARNRSEQGFGSGVIFDTRGYIATSAHVVDDSSQVDVILADGRRARAQIIGKDPKTDVAVVRINVTTPLSVARFADSSRLEVGQLVLAIGSPFALAQTVTHGIISATGRTDVDIEGVAYQNFIQTDAPTNPGNSGGPLFNTHGEVIGINTAIASGSGQFSGIAFATPSNTVLWAAKGIMSGKPLVRGYLGVGIAPLGSDRAARVGLNTTLGAVIERVTASGPASKAGLRPEDIVLQLNGTRIGDGSQLQTLIAEQPPGARATLTIWRQGQEHKIEVVFAQQPRNL